MINELTLSMAEFGSRGSPAIVALHGGNGRGQMWAKLANERFSHLHWVCPDLRGHGTSPLNPEDDPWNIPQYADDVVGTLDVNGIDSVDVIGASGGGRVAIELAKRIPSRVRSLILLDPPLMTRSEWIAWRERHLQSDGSILIEEFDSVDELIETAAPGLAGDGRSEAMEVLIEQIERTPSGRFRLRNGLDWWNRTTEGVAASLPASFGEFDGHTLLMVAQRYDACTEAGLRGAVEQLGSRLNTVYVDAGHALLWEAFDDVADLAAEFLRKQRQARGEPKNGA